MSWFSQFPEGAKLEDKVTSATPWNSVKVKININRDAMMFNGTFGSVASGLHAELGRAVEVQT